jgi:hypothetical protein
MPFSHALVPSHSLKLLITVKSNCLEHMVRFVSLPVFCAEIPKWIIEGEFKNRSTTNSYTCVECWTAYKTHAMHVISLIFTIIWDIINILLPFYQYEKGSQANISNLPESPASYMAELELQCVVLIIWGAIYIKLKNG